MKLIAFLFLAVPFAHSEERVLVRARVFSMAPNVADALLSASDPHGNVPAMLTKVQELVARNQARVATNASVQLTTGQRQSSTGLVRLIAEVQLKQGDFDVVARIEFGEEALQTENVLHRGESIFMGSLDPKSGTNQGTMLVFLTIQ
jgi:hypothetical protein